MVGLLRHRQPKGSDSARLHLNRRATPRLHQACAVCSPFPESMSVIGIFHQLEGEFLAGWRADSFRLADHTFTSWGVQVPDALPWERVQQIT